MGSKQSKQAASSQTAIRSSPPSYTEANVIEAPSKQHQSNPVSRIGSESRDQPQRKPQIKATDVPQWLWTNAQCREWLTAALIHFCGRISTAAKILSERILNRGFGPTLYSISLDFWVRYLSTKDDYRIYAIISSRREDGGLPKGFKISETISWKQRLAPQ